MKAALLFASMCCAPDACRAAPEVISEDPYVAVDAEFMSPSEVAALRAAGLAGGKRAWADYPHMNNVGAPDPVPLPPPRL